jgi:hypothetical protein
MDVLNHKFINDGFLSEDYVAVMDQRQEDPDFVVEWNSFLQAWKFGAKTSNSTTSFVLRLLNYAMDQIRLGSRYSDTWISTLSELIVVGFRHTIGTDCYLDWLKGLKSLPNLKQKFAITEHQLYGPRLLSKVASLCMLYYLERFAMIRVKDLSAEKEISLMENEIVRNCCRADPTIVVFPLGYIAHHAMDLFLPSSQDVRSVERNLQVIWIHRSFLRTTFQLKTKTFKTIRFRTFT